MIIVSKMSWTLDKYTLSLKMIRYLIICNEKSGICQRMFKILYPWRVCKTWKLKVYFAILMGMYRNEISFGRDHASIEHITLPAHRIVLIHIIQSAHVSPAHSCFFCSQVAIHYVSRSVCFSFPLIFQFLCSPVFFKKSVPLYQSHCFPFHVFPNAMFAPKFSLGGGGGVNCPYHRIDAAVFGQEPP